MRIPLVAGVLACLCSCSSPYMRDAAPTGPPGPDEVKIVVYRPGSIGGGAKFPVYVGDRLVGFAEHGAYFEHRCAPGKRLLLAWGENDAAIGAELAGGRTYYVRAVANFGFFEAQVGFEPVAKDSDLAKRLDADLGACKCRELIPERGAQFEKEKRERVLKLIEVFERGEKKPRVMKADDGR
ncbi:MAG: hypothetical protein HYY17_02575 [Planctomycetes bacterium]|nr:hypothetical protein [Planctomycetota bacterium]